MYSILSGVKSLDLSRLLPGALCSMMLADMGADVLKIEDTSQGDYMRWMPPMVNELSAYFLLTNRNKKSMKLDLKTAQGKDILFKARKAAWCCTRKLSAWCDGSSWIGLRSVKKGESRHRVLCS